ncbi:dTDP-4-dehydrorhamnose reductase [Tenacibaculum aiptasiae]|uniref:dTDP-4-dehydrorhamnose reductase n=1 Tax=Tenacibaculum aiptasiae TaxID=426481 RepID=A0A7J5A6V6_9FLAO|nr:dTDP-4-dehydrorhamnose reductase [Tenacibaculum aiptasiae]KAB1153286.1 dTDP-4-dehydrorhamnose reductase [Tenacibaculum aiptasiae]
MNILITGSNGQLGSEIKDLSSDYSRYNFFFEDSKSLDITDLEKVKTYILKKKIQAVVNCAAYTAVDKAEIEKEKAEQVNYIGVSNLIKGIELVEGKLIHISTDYVFNGKNVIPYKEEDNISPINVYGKTKLKGEEEVLKSSVEAIIIRTSWLYSIYRKNFVKTILRLGKEKKELNVVYDQIGVPTYAKDLAKVCLDIIGRNKIDKNSKIYHYSNEGVTSWYDFAKAIIEISKIDCKVYPIDTKQYPTPAKRPSYSLLNNSKIKEDFDIKIPYWRDSLKDSIDRIKNE